MIAFGQLGLHPWELDEYTMTEFALKLEGHRENELREWERMRIIAYYTFLPHAKNKKLKIEKFMPLASDKKYKEPDLKDQIKQLKAYQDQKYKKV